MLLLMSPVLEDNRSNQLSLSGHASSHRRQKNVLCSPGPPWVASQSSSIPSTGKQRPSLTIKGQETSSSGGLLLSHDPAAKQAHPALLSVSEFDVKKSVMLVHAEQAAGNFQEIYEDPNTSRQCMLNAICMS